MQMIRTSLFLPATLYQQLRTTSQHEGKSFSDLARELFTDALSERKRNTQKSVYTSLKELNGVAKEPITDASTTLNEVLYGESNS